MRVLPNQRVYHAGIDLRFRLPHKRVAADSTEELDEIEVAIRNSGSRVDVPRDQNAEWHFPQENATFYKANKCTVTLELL
jgi:hypothetical protein